MEVLVLHILKLNIIAAVIILLVKLLAVPLKGRVSARWKYFIWLFVAVSLLIPARVPGSISLVDLQLKSTLAASGGGWKRYFCNCTRKRTVYFTAGNHASGEKKYTGSGFFQTEDPYRI